MLTQENYLFPPSIMYHVSHPLAQKKILQEGKIDFQAYLSKVAPSYAPDSVKTLLSETEFVESIDKIQIALKGSKNHVVWQPQECLLLDWKRGDDHLWSLKIFCQPPSVNISSQILPTSTSLGGGIATLISVLMAYGSSWDSQLSQWTSDLKTRIDPVGLTYDKLPPDIFSEEWFKSLEKENWTALFLPLEQYRVPTPLLPKDNAGYLQRFMTPSRKKGDVWWLYKAWMRHCLPLNDYKKFHFFIRFTLFEEHKKIADESQQLVCYEIASKLMRSLLKNKFFFNPDVKERLQISIHKHLHTANKISTPASVCLMPPSEIHINEIESLPESLPESITTHERVLSTPEAKTVLPFQWNKLTDPVEELPNFDDPIWDISNVAMDDRVDKVIELATTYRLIDSVAFIYEFENVISLKRLVIFKKLIVQINEKFAESLCFFSREALFFHREELTNRPDYEEWQSYYKAVIPKNELIMELWILTDSNFSRTLPKNDLLAKLVLCSLENIAEKDLPEGYLDKFPDLLDSYHYPNIANLKKNRDFLNQFPKTFRFLNILVRSRRLRSTYHFPSHYLAESAVTRGESFDPWNTPMTVIREVLPYTSPTQALINYSQLHSSWKYRKEALEDLFNSFFQEAWLTEELKKNSEPSFFGGKAEVELKLLLNSRGQGCLPWVQSLKNPYFKRFLERFLKDQYSELVDEIERSKNRLSDYSSELWWSENIIALLRLSALCVRECKTLKVPHFEHLITQYPAALAPMDKKSKEYDDIQKEKYLSVKERLKTVYLYLFWLHSEQGKPSQKFRPLTNDIFNRRYDSWFCRQSHPDIPSSKWLDADKEHILFHLKTLPDLLESELCYDYFENIKVEAPFVLMQNEPTVEKTTAIPVGDPKKMSFAIGACWWNGEPIVLEQELSITSSYRGDNWTLKERPYLFWRAAAHGQLHGNELIDKETHKVVAYVFHLQEEKLGSFLISCDKGVYSPNTIEESLCLLLHYSKANDRLSQWKIIQQLPQITHKLSSTALQLMQQIIASLEITPTRFDQLGLSMQILCRFQTWIENPTLGLHATETLLMTKSCIAMWELYRNLQQNVSQEHVLTSVQRRDMSSLVVRQMKELFSNIVTSFAVPKKITDFCLKFLNRQQPTSNYLAWQRSIRIQPMNTRNFFQASEAMIVSLRYSSRVGIIYSIAARTACQFARLIGWRYVWPERVKQLKGYTNLVEPFIPSQYLNSSLKLRTRMQIAAARQGCSEDDQYGFEIVDWAIAHDVIKRNNETSAEFIARVEVMKHVRGILQDVFQFACYLWTTVINFYRLFPTPIPFKADSIRDSFELFKRENITMGQSAIPSMSKTLRQFKPSDKVNEKLWENLLVLANKSSPDTLVSVGAALQEQVQRSHLTGLFVQNGMNRLTEINPALTGQECDQIDALLREALIVPNREYLYNLDENTPAVRALLMFENATAFQARDRQLEKLKILFTPKVDGRYQNLAIQMDMGEGKTSVLASIALLHAAVPGRISIFVPPSAQFETLANMLPKWQKERYQQEVIPLNMSFDLMQQVSSLEWLYDRLLQAKQRGHVLLFHPTTLHNLRLAWLSSKDTELLKILFSIRSEIKNHGDLLLDEIDQSIDPFKDASMAYGKYKEPTLRHLKQFQFLIQLHQEDPKIWQALCKNAPEEIDLLQYARLRSDVIAPILAKEFTIPAIHQESFCRYILGNANRGQDDAFLKWLSVSEQRDEIAQHKHWLEDILPFTPFRERGRHFGRNGDKAEVIPYAGVGAPAPGTTKFAQLGEEISYYWLTALSSQLDVPKFEEVFASFKFRFNNYSKKNNLPGKEKVCKEFKEITGCNLETAINEVKEKKKALENVNKSPFSRLKCEIYLARANVKYFESQFTSTSQDFMNMFSTHRGFSGTFPGYIHAFDHVVVPDSISDKSVIDAMLKHDEPVLLVQNIEELFLEFKGDPDMGGVIDIGGLYRDFNNEQVARQALADLPHIEFALYFGKGSATDSTPDFPILLQKLPCNGIIKHLIGSTDSKILENWGVKLENLFVFYDQRHCEATNVIQLPNRRNAITFGFRSTKRDLLQGLMRLRLYKQEKRQKVVYVMQPKTLEKLFGDQKPNAYRILEKSKIIEHEETEKRTLRTYYHRVDAAFCTVVEDYIASHLDETKKCEQLRMFLLRCLNDPSAYNQFGGIAEEEICVNTLKEYIASCQKRFAKIYPEALPESLKGELEKIQKAVVKDNYLPKKIKSRQKIYLGQEQQQEVQQQVQQEQQQEQQTERILPSPGTGSPWKEVRDYRSIRLSDHYGSLFNYCHLISRGFEAKLFEGLFASENYLHTYKTAYALNHPDQKRANYILMERKEGQLVATVLAGYDYHNYSIKVKELPKNSCICFWRPSKKGNVQYLQGDLKIRKNEKSMLSKIRLQIAFLNGDVSYIVDHLSDLNTPLNSNHLNFLKKRVEYWQLTRDCQNWWSIVYNIAHYLGYVRPYIASNFPRSKRRDAFFNKISDQQGRSWSGLLYEQPEKDEALSLIDMLEESQ